MSAAMRDCLATERHLLRGPHPRKSFCMSTTSNGWYPVVAEGAARHASRAIRHRAVFLPLYLARAPRISRPWARIW